MKKVQTHVGEKMDLGELLLSLCLGLDRDMLERTIAKSVGDHGVISVRTSCFFVQYYHHLNLSKK